MDGSAAYASSGLCFGAVRQSHIVGVTAVAAPKQPAELSLHGLPSHSKWLPEERPLFGSYLASGDGEGAGALAGHILWDLY